MQRAGVGQFHSEEFEILVTAATNDQPSAVVMGTGHPRVKF